MSKARRRRQSFPLRTQGSVSRRLPSIIAAVVLALLCAAFPLAAQGVDVIRGQAPTRGAPSRTPTSRHFVSAAEPFGGTDRGDVFTTPFPAGGLLHATPGSATRRAFEVKRLPDLNSRGRRGCGPRRGDARTPCAVGRSQPLDRHATGARHHRPACCERRDRRGEPAGRPQRVPPLPRVTRSPAPRRPRGLSGSFRPTITTPPHASVRQLHIRGTRTLHLVVTTPTRSARFQRRHSAFAPYG